MKKEMTKTQQKTLGAVLLAAALMLLGAWLVGGPLVRFLTQPERFRSWVEQRGPWGRLAYLAMVIVQVIIALIPGEPFEIAAGYAFGALEGTALCLLASTMGSMLVFLLIRRFGQKPAELFFSREKLERIAFLKSAKRRELLFWLIFMIPGTPKDLLCYFAGLTDLRPGVWLLICSLGRLPAIVTSTVGGDALGTKNYGFAAAVFAGTLAVSGLGLLLYQRFCDRHQTKAQSDG